MLIRKEIHMYVYKFVCKYVYVCIGVGFIFMKLNAFPKSFKVICIRAERSGTVLIVLNF